MYCIAKSMRIGSLGLALVLLAASIAGAQQPGQPGPAGQSGMTQRPQDQGRSTGMQRSQQMDPTQASSQFQPQLERINRLIGSDVLNKQGEKIGKVRGRRSG